MSNTLDLCGELSRSELMCAGVERGRIGVPHCISSAPSSGSLPLQQLGKGQSSSGEQGVMVAAAQEGGSGAAGPACVQTEVFRVVCVCGGYF